MLGPQLDMKSTIFEKKRKEKSHFPEIDIHEIVYTSKNETKKQRNKELVDYPHHNNDIASLFTQRCSECPTNISRSRVHALTSQSHFLATCSRESAIPASPARLKEDRTSELRSLRLK